MNLLSFRPSILILAFVGSFLLPGQWAWGQG
jgi:hypothetical protein